MNFGRYRTFFFGINATSKYIIHVLVIICLGYLVLLLIMADFADLAAMNGAMDHHMMADAALIDQAIDTHVIAMRGQQQVQLMNDKMKQLVANTKQNTTNTTNTGVNEAVNNQVSTQQESKEDEIVFSKFKDAKIIYNSLNRGACYHAFAWMWCGCFEPKYKITSTYAIGEEWEGCLRITDSMAYENVEDVQRQQSCCWCFLSWCPLCPCFNDMADVLLLGNDDSHSTGWRLKRLHNSTSIFDKLTKIVQDTYKDIGKGKNHYANKAAIAAMR